MEVTDDSRKSKVDVIRTHNDERVRELVELLERRG